MPIKVQLNPKNKAYYIDCMGKTAAGGPWDQLVDDERRSYSKASETLSRPLLKADLALPARSSA